MISIVCFKWRAPHGYRSTFTGEQVDTMRRMVKRNFPHPHRFICVTDDPTGINEPDVEIFELWNDFAGVANPSGRKNPSCYRRLKVFAANAGNWLGERFVVVDLDAVIVGDMSPLWLRTDPFIIWKSQTAGNFYNGSMFMLDAGARPRVWEDFDPVISPRLTKQAHLYGSDQAWIAFALGGRESTWGPEDGVYSMRNNIAPGGNRLPENARIVFFHGRGDPWEPAQKKIPWVAKHYR